MRSFTTALALAWITSAGLALTWPGSLLAQTPPATIGQPYVPAPWWMRDPVIASIGQVRVEIPANRAGFNATFQSIDRSAAEASARSAGQVRALSQALAAYGVERARVETTLTTRPLYEQYRDEAGNLRDNVRPDKIQRYQTEATVRIAIRDVAILERVYATVVATQPISITPVWFNLEPENEWKTRLAAEAMKDARRRAILAVENAGASLGSVRLIDPTGRACETDVLVGWPSYASTATVETSVDEINIRGSRSAPDMAFAPQSPPAMGEAPSEDQIEAARLALQPPLQVMTDKACVVFGLN